MSETSVSSNLLQSFEILSEFGIQLVGDELGPGSVSDVSLSVQEPFGDVVICKKLTTCYLVFIIMKVYRKPYQWV
jgi:hypothetical protein